MNSRSVSRLLFLFEVININNQNIGAGSSFFIVKDRSWMGIYKRFASNLNINLYTIPEYNNRVHPQRFQNFYLFAKYFYHSFNKQIFSPQIKLPVLDNNLFIEGRDDINFENNGENSDYFWSMNSDFPIKNRLNQVFF